MMKNKNKEINTKNVKSLDEDIAHYQALLEKMQNERKKFNETSEKTKKKNDDLILELQKENKELDKIKIEINANRKASLTANLSKTVGTTLFGNKDEIYWKKQYDNLKNLVYKKRKVLLNLQDKLNEVNDIKNEKYEESPLTKQIRILENKLDKIMIKFNEAQSIKKTYEQIVKRLKEERIGYDNQLAAIERSLKGKEHDYTELLLLSHDATHAKELAQSELKKYQNKKTAVRKLREKYIEEKKKQLEFKNEKKEKQEKIKKEIRKSIKNEKINNLTNDILLNNNDTYNYENNSNINDEINDFEEGFKKLKEITGVSDVNEIIQKYNTQDETSKSLKDLESQYQEKNFNLLKEKEKLKEEVNILKFEKNENQIINQIDEKETNTNNNALKCERLKLKYEKLNKIYINLKSGIEHLLENLNFYPLDKKQIEDAKNSSKGEIINEQLLLISVKLKLIYDIVSRDNYFLEKINKQENLFKVNELLNNYVNPNLFDKNLNKENITKMCGFSNDEDLSDEYYDDNMDL